MSVAIIRGAALNKWEMQNFEALVRDWDCIGCAAEDGLYPTERIQIPVKKFRVADAKFKRYGVAARAAARAGLWKRPPEYLVGLEAWLSDKIIAHTAETAIAFSEQAIRAKRAYGVKVVVTCWETIPFAYEEDPVIRTRRAVVRQNADLFLPTTRRAARALEIEGVEPERIRVVMPGVDVERFMPAHRPLQLMQCYGVGHDDIILLFIGRLIREKGVRELIVALSMALRALPKRLANKCRLLIAGTGEQGAYIENLIEYLNLQENARVVGGLDYMEIHQLHQLADIFILPSIATPYWEEQYGMVLAEAMACGSCVVATTTGGIPEVLSDAGVLVPPLEPDTLSEVLVQLIRDEAVRKDFGRKARVRAVEALNAQTVANSIGAIYQSLTQT